MNQNEIARRSFLTATAITAASYSRVLGANDTIQLGVIGAGDRGTYVMTNFQKNTSVHVAAVCDVYSEHIDRARQKARAQRTGPSRRPDRCNRVHPGANAGGS